MQKTLCAYIAGAAFAAAGCHAYQPYGYGYPGAYQMPSYADGGGYAVVQPQGGLQPAPVWNGSANSSADLGLPKTGTASNSDLGLPNRNAPRTSSNNGLPTANTPPEVLEERSAESVPPRQPARPIGATVPDPSEVGRPSNALTGEDADTVPRAPASPGSLDGDAGRESPYDPVNNGDNETISPIEKMSAETAFPAPNTLNSLEEDGARPVVSAPKGPNPYSYDAKKFEWLRGIIEQDDEHGVWRLRYSTDENAEYNGILTLKDDQDLLSAVQPGDVVLVKGRLDHAHRDAQNRSSYYVDSAKRLVPKPPQ